jgi:hypothetical protein
LKVFGVQLFCSINISGDQRTESLTLGRAKEFRLLALNNRTLIQPGQDGTSRKSLAIPPNYLVDGKIGLPLTATIAA